MVPKTKSVHQANKNPETLFSCYSDQSGAVLRNHTVAENPPNRIRGRSSSPVRSCSDKPCRSLETWFKLEFRFFTLLWMSSWPFWIKSNRPPWRITVSFRPETHVHKLETCLFSPKHGKHQNTKISTRNICSSFLCNMTHWVRGSTLNFFLTSSSWRRQDRKNTVKDVSREMRSSLSPNFSWRTHFLTTATQLEHSWSTAASAVGPQHDWSFYLHILGTVVSQ